MSKSYLMLLILSLAPMIHADEPAALAQEDEWLITDRDNGSRDRPNLFDYNRENVQYNRLHRDTPASNAYEQRDSFYNPSQDSYYRSQDQEDTNSNVYYYNR